MKEIAEHIIYVGVDDHEMDLFEGQYKVPKGMSYNSYVILDEKTAVMDTVDIKKTKEWLENVKKALAGRKPDYLVIQHMEPDHSASIEAFMQQYPQTTVVGNIRTFGMMEQFFPQMKLQHILKVKDGECLKLGRHTLQFMFAPMIHWPEVMMTYEACEKILFSADGFGKFGALDAEEDWTGEAARYYFGIVGKYGMQVQDLLKKAAGLDIRMICPLHGPVLTQELAYYLGLYDIWSSYRPEKEGVCICYSSIYGHTAEAVKLLAGMLEKAGVSTICHDLARTDMAEAVKDAFCYDRLVLASVTYNGGVFPHMKTFLAALGERGYRSRKVAFIENGSWAPMAGKQMQTVVRDWKDIILAEHTVTVRSALNEESALQIQMLAQELAAQESAAHLNAGTV